MSRLLGCSGNRGNRLSLRLLADLNSPLFGRCNLISQPKNESLSLRALALKRLADLPGFDDEPLRLGLGSLESLTRLNLRVVANLARLLAGTVKLGGGLLAALQCLGSIGFSALPKFANLGLGLATPSLHFGLKSCPLLRQRCLARSTPLVGFGADPRRLALGKGDKLAMARLGTALGFCDQSSSLLLSLGNDVLRRGRHLSRMLLSLTMRLLRLRHPSLRLSSHNLSLATRLIQLGLSLATRLIQLGLNLATTLRQLRFNSAPILPNRSLRLGTQPNRLLISSRRHLSRVLLSLTMRLLRLRHPSLRLSSHNLSLATRLIQLGLNLATTLRQLRLDPAPILPNRSLRLGTQPSRLLISSRRHLSRMLLSLRHLGGRGLLDLGGPLLSFRLECGNPLFRFGNGLLG